MVLTLIKMCYNHPTSVSQCLASCIKKCITFYLRNETFAGLLAYPGLVELVVLQVTTFPMLQPHPPNTHLRIHIFTYFLSMSLEAMWKPSWAAEETGRCEKLHLQVPWDPKTDKCLIKPPLILSRRSQHVQATVTQL